MNVSIMLDELVLVVGKATENHRLGTKHGTFRAPQVVLGYLPTPDPKNPLCIEDYPFVIVRYLSDEADEDGSKVVVKLLCGVYSCDDQRGWQELLNIMNTLRTHFLSNPRFGNCFEIELPLKREIPEEQDPPQWVGEITLNVTIPHVVEEVSYVRDFFR